MGRFGWIVAAATALVGFYLGRNLVPPSSSFPSPDQARSADEMETEVSRALRETRAFPRASALVRLYESLTTGNVEGAARVVRLRAGAKNPVDLELFLAAWTHLDPTAAMDEVQSWPIRSRRELGIQIVMREWAASGRQLEAGNFYDTLTDPDLRALAADPLVHGWALGGDVEGALGLARRFWEAEERRDVVDGLMQGVLRARGPEVVLDLARQVEPLTGDPFAQRVALAALDLAGREDPAATAAYYDELVDPGPSPWLDGNLVRLAGLLRNESPVSALEWLLPKADGPERARALTETMGTWAKRDFEAAWTWFERHSDAARRADAALSATDSALLAGLVRRMARIRPEQAAPWAVRLRTGSERLEMLRRVAYFWSMRDPVAAERWLAELDLADAERAHLSEAARWGRSTGGDLNSEPPDSGG